MTQHIQHLVVNATAKNKLDVTAPFDDTLICTIDTLDETGVEQAFSTAEKLFSDRKKWLSAEQRIAILEKTATLMSQQAEQLALEAAREGGKPLLDSKVEVARAIDGVKTCIELMRSESGTEIPMRINAASAQRMAMTVHEPIGIVVAVSAFNHPLNLIIHQVAPAVASGCPVIVKPAGDTPVSCFRFVQLLHEAGLPAGWAQALVTENSGVSEKLVTDKRVGFFSFIGSAKIGWMLRSKLAPGARCALEHGGAAPVIVEQDADLDAGLPLLAKGGFYHAGQVCVSVQRVFAHSSIAQQVADKLAQLGSAMQVGDPTQAATEIGPLIRHKEVDRVDEWVQEAISKGAKCISGGKKISASCYEATVLYNPPENVRASTNEIFGPVICVYSYDDVDEAIQRANSLDVAFQAAVLTRDIDKAMHAFKHLDASAVMINDHTAFRVDWMPFAGLRHSGLGVGGIPHTFKDMQIEKMLVLKSAEI